MQQNLRNVRFSASRINRILLNYHNDIVNTIICLQFMSLRLPVTLWEVNQLVLRDSDKTTPQVPEPNF